MPHRVSSAWVLLPLLGLVSASIAAGGPQPPAVVLELFTSQGCSSCPPADRLLSRLGVEPLVNGVRVVPLAFHVDYWDRIVWNDPFASAAWSDRQRRYARVFDLRSVYTPQLVVDGVFEMVGSNAAEVTAAIAARAAAPRLATIEIVPVGSAGENSLVLDVGIRFTSLPPGRQRLIVAVVESGFETAVGQGENHGKTLANDHVVRRLETPHEIAGAADTELRKRIEVELDPAWNRERLGIAVFLQDPESLAVSAADLFEPAATSAVSAR